MWYLKKGGVRSGPFTDAQVRERLNLGMAGPLDGISSDGQRWQTVRDSEFWKQERTIPDPHAARAGRKISLASGAPPITTISPSSPPSRPISPNVPPQPVLVAQTPSRPRFHNWWLAVAIPCATFLILCIIGLFIPESPGGGGGAAGDGGAAGGSTAADNGYRGEELTPLDYSKIDPIYHDFYRYITPSYSEIKQIFQMVATSEHVAENLQYANALSTVRIYHDPSNSQINAYATIIDPTREEEWPTMVVLGGMGRFSRVLAACLTEFGVEDIEILLGVLGSAPEIGADGALGLLTEHLDIPLERFSDEAWLSNAKSISRGIMLGVLAHEAGHIALGHVWGWNKGSERSRNQEREADSFAHSVASGSADADSMFAGNLMFHFAYAINEAKNGDSEMARTHPYSEERLFNLIRDNASTAKLYGITEEEMRQALEEARKNFR